jgi:hypothetical protein
MTPGVKQNAPKEQQAMFAVELSPKKKKKMQPEFNNIDVP